jgi:HSP20 family molecular chaperone IbpA
MNDWTKFIEKWFYESQITFTDCEFDLVEQELLAGFDELTEDFDRAFNDDLKELEFSESCTRIRSENVREELILLHSSYSLSPKPSKNIGKNKTRKGVKPASVQRRNRLNSKIPSSTVEKKEGRELYEDIIVTDENIKVVSQLPFINRRENIQVMIYSDNSVSISYLSSKGKRSSRTSVIPYGIDIETARSTYRNGILEITFNRK